MSVSLQEAIRQVETLSQDEQRKLITAIQRRLRMKSEEEPPKSYSWKAAAGTVPYPLTGEDAQAWVTRTRAEGEPCQK